MPTVYVKYNPQTDKFTWELTSERPDYGEYRSLCRVKTAIKKFFPSCRMLFYGVGSYAN